jgi:hypothetical protein
MLICEMVEPQPLQQDKILYHWTNWAKATTAVKSNKLAARKWEHYIESENRMVKGTSWSTDPTRWRFISGIPYTVRFRIDPNKIPNKKFEINGDRVYYQTMGMRGIRPADEYKKYTEEPNETFIEGPIIDFKDALISVLVTGEFNFKLVEFKQLLQEKGIAIEK